MDRRLPLPAANCLLFPRNAEGGTRTPTGCRPLHPECSASTNSTTSARRETYRRTDTQVNAESSSLGTVTKAPKDQTIVPIARNKRARHDYEILETWEAGLVLTGTEVKSLRDGRAQIGDAYAVVKDGELWLLNAHIAPYDQGNIWNHDPVRTRKLLLHQKEIRSLIGAVERKGLTLVALELYFKHGRAKVRIGLARGKQQHDKRADLKAREDAREMQRALRAR